MPGLWLESIDVVIDSGREFRRLPAGCAKRDGRARPAWSPVLDVVWGRALPLVAGALALVLLSYLGGCGAHTANGRGGRLVYMQRGEPRTFNPMYALDDASHEVIWRMHADLIHINRETQKTEPALAESWSALPGGTGFRLNLRRNVRFSDGQPFDADDVLFTFQAHLDASVNSAQRELLLVQSRPIQVRKIDRYTVEFDLGGPYGPAERIFDSIAILPRHLLEHSYKSGQLPGQWGLATAPPAMAGLGPFRLKNYRSGEGLVLERNPYYWKQDSKGATLPYLNEILFRQVGNEEGQVLRFLGGEGDLLNRVSAKSFALLENDAKARHLDLRDLGAGPEYVFLFFNLNPANSVPASVAGKQVWFRDARFRRAVSLAIDREAMVRLVYGGRATPLATHVTPGIRMWTNSKIPPPVRSVADARKLLAEAGFRVADNQPLRDRDGRAVEFTILVSSSNQQRAQMAAMLQQDLKELGINSQVAPLERQTVQDRVLRSKNYEVCLFGLAFGDADPGSEMNVWPSSGPTHVWAPSQQQPGSDWEAEIDRLMRQQMATEGYGARKRLYDQVQEIEARETPIVSLLSPNVLVVARRGVGNFRPAVLDHYTLWNAEELFLGPEAGAAK